MEKKLLKLAKIIKQHNIFGYVALNTYAYSNGNTSIRYVAWNGKVECSTQASSSLKGLIDKLIEVKWITKEDLESKKRIKKEHIINKGKL